MTEKSVVVVLYKAQYAAPTVPQSNTLQRHHDSCRSRKNNRLVHFSRFRRLPLSNPHSCQTVDLCALTGVGTPASHLSAQPHSLVAVDSILICSVLTWLGDTFVWVP